SLALDLAPREQRLATQEPDLSPRDPHPGLRARYLASRSRYLASRPRHPASRASDPPIVASAPNRRPDSKAIVSRCLRDIETASVDPSPATHRRHPARQPTLRAAHRLDPGTGRETRARR